MPDEELNNQDTPEEKPELSPEELYDEAPEEAEPNRRQDDCLRSYSATRSR